MTNLSPAAQAVLDASMVHSGPAFETIVRRMLADALRTVVDQEVLLMIYTELVENSCGQYIRADSCHC
jgi:hypothetical protein